MMNHLRYEKRNRAPVLEDAEDLLLDPSEGPAEVAISRATSDWLSDQLGTLTDRQREVAVCRYWLGLTNGETARYLGTSHARITQLEGEVKRRLRDFV